MTQNVPGSHFIVYILQITTVPLLVHAANNFGGIFLVLTLPLFRTSGILKLENQAPHHIIQL